MAKKQRKNHAPQEPLLSPKARAELAAVACLVAALVSGLAYFRLAGPAGAFIDSALAAAFGHVKFLMPIILLGIAGHIAWPEKFQLRAPTALGLFLFFVGFGGILNIVLFPRADALLYADNVSRAGGYLGLLLAYPLLSAGSLPVAAIVLAALTFVSLVLTFNVSIHDLSAAVLGLRHRAWPWPFGHRDRTTEDTQAQPQFVKKAVSDDGSETAETPVRVRGMTGDEPADAQSAALTAAVKRKRSTPISIPLDILENRNAKPTSGDIHGRMMVIKKTLENFGIPVDMGEISVGPTVTQFTLKPAEGIKLARLTSLSNDLALSLAAHPIRIEAPIPGKSLVGIEVPNQVIATVGLREVLESKEFRGRGSGLTICLGKDVAGKPWTADLGKMPHLLVAGATGSGKTVCLNAIILSLLYQNGPDDMKLILIDPKRVELPVYNGIPHLLTPAITDVPKTINALKWAIGEMDRRFEVLSAAGKRDIGAYNATADDKMPYIVVVIDELADLMVASASEVEASIIRLAQMARAVGIHLIVATQRPSVDIITGLIKANITTRIAFSVASATDSRTILDSTGAEKLVGRGDMLYMAAELSKPKRIQCCYVSDMDIRKVVDHIKSELEEPVSYEDEVVEKRAGTAYGFGYNDDGDDELLNEARDTVVKAGKASASYLQRRLKIGYARAARLLDLLEEKGIIGPGDGAKPRQILVSPVEDVDGRHYSDDE
jgi:S-DNA-T family DNA segregation ATPase FtsK/SpoIIIE